MNHLGIDVMTKHKGALMSRLRALKTTHNVWDGGAYREDRNYSQVHLLTSWTEKRLDDWLYGTTGIEYIGIFQGSESCLT